MTDSQERVAAIEAVLHPNEKHPRACPCPSEHIQSKVSATDRMWDGDCSEWCHGNDADFDYWCVRGREDALRKQLTELRERNEELERDVLLRDATVSQCRGPAPRSPRNRIAGRHRAHALGARQVSQADGGGVAGDAPASGDGR